MGAVAGLVGAFNTVEGGEWMAMNSLQRLSVGRDRLGYEEYGTGDLVVGEQSRLILLLKLLQ